MFEKSFAAALHATALFYCNKISIKLQVFFAGGQAHNSVMKGAKSEIWQISMCLIFLVQNELFFSGYFVYSVNCSQIINSI